jgi:murein DD-endopeptidase MepM/ murein hydrolase activator NlpD
MSAKTRTVGLIGAPSVAVAVSTLAGAGGVTAIALASSDGVVTADGQNNKVMAAAMNGKGFVSEGDLVDGDSGVGGAPGSNSVTADDHVVSSSAPQMLTGEYARADAPIVNYDEQLRKAIELSDKRAEEDRLARMPSTVLPAQGTYTSGFGARWGTSHNGVDIANSVGTPIYAAMDGVVIDAGPAQGYGQWVRLLHGDGSITVYGHVETFNVSAGESVMAGQQIAGMGNRGFSTGPHLHFEIWPDGATPVDPVSWLQEHGVDFG